MIRVPFLTDPPLTPDADEARQQLLNELSKPAYQEREANWFDYLSQQVWDWIQSLGTPGDVGNIFLLLLITLLIVGAIMAAFLVFGKPRLKRKSALRYELFGEEDERSAAELRQAAAKAASATDWNEAVVLQFRALARAMAERTISHPTPGTTAQGFAGQLSESFPGYRDSLFSGVAAFDAVRYLERPGTEIDYRQLRDLDATLAQATPQKFATVGELR